VHCAVACKVPVPRTVAVSVLRCFGVLGTGSDNGVAVVIVTTGVRSTKAVPLIDDVDRPASVKIYVRRHGCLSVAGI
jgi:hypothetical protein